MTKGDKSNTGEEFFYKLEITKGFLEDLKKARKQLGISEKGSTNNEERLAWIKKNPKNSMDFLAIQLQLKEKYNIPEAYWWSFLDDYIFFGKAVNAITKQSLVAFIDPLAHKVKGRNGNPEELYWENGEPYVKMFILGNAQKNDVHNFIDANWEKIKDILMEQGATMERTHRTEYKDRNKFIWKLCRIGIRQLEVEYGIKANNRETKESLICKIVQAQGFGGVTEGYVKKIGYG